MLSAGAFLSILLEISNEKEGGGSFGFATQTLATVWEVDTLV
jgi:hypothetical protein